MEKYRIKQVGEKYYPQVKTRLFWRNLSDVEANFTSDYPRQCSKAWFHRCDPKLQSFIDVKLETVHYYYTSFEDAKRYIDEYKNRFWSIEYKGHQILQCSNDYFVDVSCNVYHTKYDTVYTLYARNLDELKIKIDKFEQRRRTAKIRKTFNID